MLSKSNPLKIAALAFVLVLAACTTKPKTAEAPPPEGPPPASTQNQVESTVVPGSVQDFRVNVGDTVHFEYDKYDIKGQDRDLLQRQAQWLQKYAQVRVTVEGHCDERGTREYNLALGARRANAVKEYLVSLGVPSARVDTISYGKERPICTESDESCWAQNRRGVTTITSGATTS
ncbi:MAG TPA: peptidoglycan-associated lipoprotein Pal [Rhizomicrobium sp.]|jgi:peptidoglycan-associated lipoprotein|nr:peptidoglycan-associated lipoprotein Pal [Rhizomicrobium sp.]